MFRVLSIDGGGIRGIIPAHWLDRLRQRLRTNKLSEHFDLIVGTSTGSLLSAAIAFDYPRGDQDIRLSSIYKKNGKRIFEKRDVSEYLWNFPYLSPQYDADDLGACLREVFSEGAFLSDSPSKLCITSYDVFSRNPYIMRSYSESGASIKLWEACKASCSAPTYFSAHPIEIGDPENDILAPRKVLIDGGVVANNPSAYALAEAVDILGCENLIEASRSNEIKLLSLGTGNLIRPISEKDAISWGAFHWARPIIDVLMDGSSASVHEICRTILSNKNYIRLQSELRGVSDDMDEISSKNIQDLVNLADSSFDRFEEEGKIDQILEWLSP